MRAYEKDTEANSEALALAKSKPFIMKIMMVMDYNPLQIIGYLESINEQIKIFMTAILYYTISKLFI